MTTAASRSPGSAPRTCERARIPPADPTSATTSIGGETEGLSAVGTVMVEQKPPDHERVTLRFLDHAIVPFRPFGRSHAAESVGNAPGKVGTLLERAQRCSEHTLDRPVMLDGERVRAERVPDPAAKAQ